MQGRVCKTDILISGLGRILTIVVSISGQFPEMV